MRETTFSTRCARRVAVAAVAAVVLASCSGSDVQYGGPGKDQYGRNDPLGDRKNEGMFGADGLNLFGSSKKVDSGSTGGIGVNSYLWRASLDSIAFMPLSSADPFGGVIITDWFAPPETPNERFKLNIYILGTQLRADGVKAAVFRQRLDPAGSWIDAAVENKTSFDLENVILTRARELRINSER